MDGWTTTWIGAGAVALGALLVVIFVVLLVGLARSRSQTRAALEQARVAQEELASRLALLERPAPVGSAPEALAEFVITEVGSPSRRDSDDREDVGDDGPRRIAGRLFADIVLRETVVKAASWGHGVRHALSAENRNRLRFEMRRETKRSGKRRKADVKEALRQFYANQERSPSQASAPNRQEDVA